MESKIRFLNRNRTLNQSKFDYDSSLESQNRELNRRFTVSTVLGGSILFGQKKFKFFWLNRNRIKTRTVFEPKPLRTETASKPLKIWFKFNSYKFKSPNSWFRPWTETDRPWSGLLSKSYFPYYKSKGQQDMMTKLFGWNCFHNLFHQISITYTDDLQLKITDWKLLSFENSICVDNSTRL